ncbi:MAG: MoaD/ThiS family protein [Bdellovibrionales bacterium]|nr:MoaD/ThiS family protein [Bdellovibrionales bacterium]
MENEKQVKVRYFAVLREKSSQSEEVVTTAATTYRELFVELQKNYNFPLDDTQIKVAVNDAFSDLDQAIQGGEEIIFIPPVAGG